MQVPDRRRWRRKSVVPTRDRRLWLYLPLHLPLRKAGFFATVAPMGQGPGRHPTKCRPCRSSMKQASIDYSRLWVSTTRRPLKSNGKAKRGHRLICQVRPAITVLQRSCLGHQSDPCRCKSLVLPVGLHVLEYRDMLAMVKAEKHRVVVRPWPLDQHQTVWMSLCGRRVAALWRTERRRRPRVRDVRALSKTPVCARSRVTHAS